MIPETALMVTKGTPIAKYNVEIQRIGWIRRVPELFFPIFENKILNKREHLKDSFRLKNETINFLEILLYSPASMNVSNKNLMLRCLFINE
jgi:hypothetical protein